MLGCWPTHLLRLFYKGVCWFEVGREVGLGVIQHINYDVLDPKLCAEGLPPLRVPADTCGRTCARAVAVACVCACSSGGVRVSARYAWASVRARTVALRARLDTRVARARTVASRAGLDIRVARRAR